MKYRVVLIIALLTLTGCSTFWDIADIWREDEPNIIEIDGVPYEEIACDPIPIKGLYKTGEHGIEYVTREPIPMSDLYQVEESFSIGTAVKSKNSKKT